MDNKPHFFMLSPSQYVKKSAGKRRLVKVGEANCYINVTLANLKKVFTSLSTETVYGFTHDNNDEAIWITNLKNKVS